ncbi:MAG: alpha-amylase family glycosyl hydrolase [Oscillochloridaceae bacterium umkhey_bin13]
MLRVLLVIFSLTLALAACGSPTAQTPTDLPVAASATPAASVTPAVVANPTATPDPRLPTAPPRITPQPTSPPAPLEAGWWDSSVCYEVFVRSFFDSDGDGIGDLRGLIEKLDYINDGDPNSRTDLGANCIWLMPIAKAASYHGYDTIDYYSVDPAYGTNDDFKELVRQAEARGIKIVIDLVLNHTSSEHPWFQEALRDPTSPYRDWYLWSAIKPPYKGPFGGNEVWHKSPVADEYYYGLFWGGMPDLNYRNPAVTEEARRISSFWIDEMGVAGFRLDAIKHLIEYRAVQEDTAETHNWLREYRAWLDANHPGTYTIGEIFNAAPDNLAPYYSDQLGYYFAFNLGRGIELAANFGDARRYMQEISNYDRLPYQRWAPFLTNHDQNRVMSNLGDDMNKARLAAIALLTLPGMPYVYYGEEIGMLGLKPDEDLRTPMHWTKEEFGGFTSGIPWRNPQRDYPIKNVAMQDADPASLLNTYRKLIHLHIQNPALANGRFVPLTGGPSPVAAFLRIADEEAVLVVINVGLEPLEAVALDLASSSLMVGSYSLEPLFGLPPDAPGTLVIGPGGTTQGFVPLATLPAQQGFVLRLTPINP